MSITKREARLIALNTLAGKEAEERANPQPEPRPAPVDGVRVGGRDGRTLPILPALFIAARAEFFNATGTPADTLIVSSDLYQAFCEYTGELAFPKWMGTRVRVSDQYPPDHWEVARLNGADPT